ncbi:MAG: DNA repair protein RadA, partial [Oscillospiraceae bacterium]|nr:DNA repair protein RadA [Oscillospiraceae bacterium]
MARQRTSYVCQECGYSASGWLGRCPSCGSWGSLAEERLAAHGGGKAGAGRGSRGA